MPNLVKSDSLHFIALIPPEPVRSVIQQRKEEFAKEYGPVHALRSPPHITLIPPFRLTDQFKGAFYEFLEQFAATIGAFNISIHGFGCFKPRVIFIKPDLNSSLEALQKKITDTFYGSFPVPRPEMREFKPHITIAFKDLSLTVFHESWSKLKNEHIQFNFRNDRLTLLQHDGQRWEICKEFCFGCQPLQ